MQKLAKIVIVVVAFLVLVLSLAWVYLKSSPEKMARRQVAQLEEKWRRQKYFDLTADPCAALKLRDLYESDFHPFTHSELVDQATKEKIGSDDVYYAHQYSNAVLKAKKAGLKVDCEGRPERELIEEAWGPMIHHYSNEDILFIRSQYINALRTEIDQLIIDADRIGIPREELGR